MGAQTQTQEGAGVAANRWLAALHLAVGRQVRQRMINMGDAWTELMLAHIEGPGSHHGAHLCPTHRQRGMVYKGHALRS